MSDDRESFLCKRVTETYRALAGFIPNNGGREGKFPRFSGDRHLALFHVCEHLREFNKWCALHRQPAEMNEYYRAMEQVREEIRAYRIPSLPPLPDLSRVVQ